MTPRRLERTNVTSCYHKDLKNCTASSGALSGALATEMMPSDVGLARVVDAWPGLSETIQANILALIEPRGNG